MIPPFLKKFTATFAVRADFHWRGLKYAIYHARNKAPLENLIKNQTVLIVGSGPSAADLRSIPSHAVTMTCNAGLKLWVDNQYGKGVDLYMCNERKLVKKDVESLIAAVKPRFFVTDGVKYLKRHPHLKTAYEKLLPYDMQRNYYLKPVVAPAIFPNRKTPSMGIRLLQYALYFGAKEIYIVGIDLAEGGYFWGGQNKQKHAPIDLNFLKLISKKYSNVYSLSAKSSLTDVLPHKALAAA